MASLAAPITNTAKFSVKTITLGNNDFHLLPLHQQRLTLSNASSTNFEIETDFVPVTVINWVKERFTDDDLTKIVHDFTARDDVWTIEFLQGEDTFHLSIVIPNDEDILRITDARKAIILQVPRKLVIELEKDVITIVTQPTSGQIPDGPYIMQTTTGQIFAVSRLFDDNFQAFIGGSLEFDSLSGSFEWMHEEVGLTVHPRLPFLHAYE